MRGKIQSLRYRFRYFFGDGSPYGRRRRRFTGVALTPKGVFYDVSAAHALLFGKRVSCPIPLF